MAKDYYAILGVARDASPEDIKKAFRRLARETHPDANPGDTQAEARFREIAEAYEVLNDPDRRRRYDRGDTIDIGDLLGGFGGFDDLLRSVFGDSGLFGQPTRTAPRGRDILTRIQVDLAEAAFGTDAEVTFRTNATCAVCRGSGARPGSERRVCPTCSGSGAVRMARRGLLGTVMSVSACETCSGTGEVIADACDTCGGEGVTVGDRTVKVEIPAGVDSGTRLRLSSEGEAAPRGGQSGDLYVEVGVRPDPRFERVGEDLVHRASVGMVDAALGTRIEVPLVDGGHDVVDVPAGTQPGWVHRIPGRGMGRLGRRGRGDLLVHVSVTVPSELTKQQEELLHAFLEASGGEPSPARKRRRGR